MSRRRRDERGSAGIMLVTGMLVAILTMFIGGAVLIAWFTQIRVAEQDAELAALAGVSASIRAERPCEAVARSASRNRAQVAHCTVRGSGRHVVVEVGVRVRLRPKLVFGPDELVRTATAGTT